MSDDVQDVLQRTEWPFMERRRRQFIALQTEEETQLQIRNLIDIPVTSSHIPEIKKKLTFGVSALSAVLS